MSIQKGKLTSKELESSNNDDNPSTISLSSTMFQNIFVDDNAISLLTNNVTECEQSSRVQHDQNHQTEDSYEYTNETTITPLTNDFRKEGETSMRDQYHQQNKIEESYQHQNEIAAVTLTNNLQKDGNSLRTQPDSQCYHLNESENSYEYTKEANTTLTNDFRKTSLSARYDQYHQQNDIEDSYGPSNSLIATNEGGESGRSLCWRLNPSESLSDWKLHIFNRSTRSFEVFHVHRVVLAVGPRGCEHFQDIFRQAEIQKTNNRTTRVPLIARSCKLVPCFLDYIYGNEQFEITSENALGLCYLADYFRNHSLWDHVTDYIEEDLGTVTGREHLCQYYIDSLYYDQDEFLEHILGVCARDMLSMIERNISCTNLLSEITPSHLCQILVEMEQPTEMSSIYRTRLITEYCCLHRKKLSMELFDHFTSRLLVLNSSSAITLLEASLEYDFAPYKDQKNTSQDSISSLILFQQQCIGTLSEEWEQLLELDQERVTRIMRTLSLREEHQNILVDWFQKTLIRASNQLSISRQEKKTIQHELFTLKSRYKVVNCDLQTAHKQTTISERNHTTTKSEMKTQISSWCKKNEGTNRERLADKQKWEHERMQWQLKHQRWKHEKSRMSRELKELRKKIRPMHNKKKSDHRHRNHYRTACNHSRDDPNSTNGDSDDSNRDLDETDSTTHIDDSNDLTFVTDSSSENNSLLDDMDNAARGELMYPMSKVNGMSPQFRLL